MKISIVDPFKSTDDEAKKAIWEQLTHSTHLTFVPKKWFREGAYVYGDYRGYHLKLDSIQKDDGKNEHTYTRLVLLGNNSSGADYNTDEIIFDGKNTSTEIAEFLIPGSYRLSRGTLKIDADKNSVYYEKRGIEDDLDHLQFLFDGLSGLLGRYARLVTYGGEIVPGLCEISSNKWHILRHVVVQLLCDIEQDTEIRLKDKIKNLLCRDCLSSCGVHRATVYGWKTITYHGCRNCGQSRDIFEGQVFAVLDKGMSAKKIEKAGTLRVNWLTRRKLFDFHAVEIIRATDEDVERFAVSVGNDTDPIRSSRYKEMQCKVFLDCKLSENTIRVLDKIFGKVEYV